jgi:zinc protease
MRIAKIIFITLTATVIALGAQAQGPKILTLKSPAALYEIQIMVRAGSAMDPSGKEGTANLVAQSLIEGGFGDAKNPITKEKLAEITRPWGDAATPSVRVDKQATVFYVTVPRDAFSQFVSQVLKPMFLQPQFQQAELDRLRKEALTAIQSGLRLEQQEQLGLLTLDNWIFNGTPLQNLANGTVQGLTAVTRDDLLSFYKRYYTSGNFVVSTSITDPKSLILLKSALPSGGAATEQPRVAVEAIKGHHLLIVTQPNAIATGIHMGFPISLKRGDADYWPLFIASTVLGLHRDDYGRMYNDLREARGYNYGDYSYIEYYAARPYALFPPPGTPRSQQYFSLWIRPVGHQYAHFITKAMTAELAALIERGLTASDVEHAKVKARTLYLNYAESIGRQLGYKLDDAFYSLPNGYLDTMLKSIDAVTPEQVNAAIKKHLQLANAKYVIVTNQSEAEKLANDIATNSNVVPKTPEEYHIATPIPPDKQALLDQDKQWAAYPLGISRENIHIVKADQLFESAGIPGISSGGK